MTVGWQTILSKDLLLTFGFIQIKSFVNSLTYRIYLYHLVSKLVLAQGLDSSRLEASILDVCKHVTSLIVNNDVSVNINQEYVNIILVKLVY